MKKLYDDKFLFLNILILTFLSFLFSQSHVFSHELIDAGKSKKQHTLSISAIFKNEASFLKEWIEYHQLVGVDHFYLYNAKSKDHYFSVLRPYIRDGIVTLVQWHDLPDHLKEDAATWMLSVKIPANEHAAKYRALNETKWLVFLDIDEFLVPIGSTNIANLLESYEESPGFILKSDCFDASTDSFPNRKLIIEAAGLVGPPETSIYKTCEKIIMKPELYESFSWPPYKCSFKEKKDAVLLSRNEIRINRYANRRVEELFLGKRRDKLHIDHRIYSEDEVKGILDLGYEIEDREQVIYQFVPQLLKKLGFDPGWGW